MSFAWSGTSTDPIITSWMEHTYVKVPAAENVNRNDWPVTIKGLLK